jgi:hypothetical protein
VDIVCNVWMAGVVRETWQRLLGSLVSAAKRPSSSSSVLAVVCRVGCRLLTSMAGSSLCLTCEVEVNMLGGEHVTGVYLHVVLLLRHTKRTDNNRTSKTPPPAYLVCTHYGELLSTLVHIPREHV